MNEQSPWMNGTQANNQMAAYGSVANMAAAIFGSVGANTYVQNLRFKDEDVVVEETQRDNYAFISAAGVALLLIIIIVVIAKT